MLTRLGKPAAAGDAVDLLLDCHAKIRDFLALAGRVARAGPQDQGELAAAALRVRRYFSESLPLHARDEDESVLPRLRGLDPAVDAALAAMSREHADHERPLAALLRACEALEREPGHHRELAPAIAAATAELESHFAEHLRREEEVVFPAMRRLLGAPALAEIVRELRARREGPRAG